MKDYINLEPALKLQDKLGGHFVLGHTDGEVKIKRLTKQGGFWELEAEIPHHLKQFAVENSSVALEGISLTIKKIVSNRLLTHIIPFTYDNTNLKYKHVGGWLNIEFDYLLKHKSNK